MANLKFNEKKLFEKLFNRGGYVLDFSDRTFREFFNDFNINIFSEKYNKNSGSKMNRLRAFWELEGNILVAEVLTELLNISKGIDKIDKKDLEEAERYIFKLSGKVKKVETETEFLDLKFSKFDLSLLNLDIGTESIIEQRIEEIKKCLNSGASLSVIFLCGSVLEGILLNLFSKNMVKFNTSKSAPKDKGGKDKDKKVKVKPSNQWTLSDFINVAHQENFIGLDIKEYSHTLRDFRNFIHPAQQSLMKFNPDIHTAKISWQVLQAVIADLTGNRK